MLESLSWKQFTFQESSLLWFAVLCRMLIRQCWTNIRKQLWPNMQHTFFWEHSDSLWNSQSDDVSRNPQKKSTTIGGRSLPITWGLSLRTERSPGHRMTHWKWNRPACFMAGDYLMINRSQALVILLERRVQWRNPTDKNQIVFCLFAVIGFSCKKNSKLLFYSDFLNFENWTRFNYSKCSNRFKRSSCRK